MTKKLSWVALCFLVLSFVASACSPAAVATSAPAPVQPTTAPQPTSAPLPATAVPPTAPPPTAPPAPTVVPTAAPVKLVLTVEGADDFKFFGDVAKAYMALHPNVTIDVQNVPADNWAAYFDKISTTVAGGGSIDMVRVATEGAQLMESLGLAEPIDKYFDADPQFKTEFLADVDPKLLEPFQYKGALYGLPFEWNTCAVFYNTKLFKDAGVKPPSADWTIDEFLADAQKLTKLNADGSVDIFGYEDAYFQFCLEPWIFNAGGSLLNKDMTASNVTDPNTIDALQWMHDLIWKYKVSPTGSEQGFQGNRDMFMAGKIAMYATGRWSVLGYVNANFNDWDVVPFPKWRQQINIYGVGSTFILSKSKNKDAAWEFIKYMNNVDWAKKNGSIGFGIPQRKSAAYDQAVMGVFPPANYKFWYDVLQNGRPVEAPPQYNQVESIFLRYVDEIVKNETPVKDAAQKMDAELNAALKP